MMVGVPPQSARRLLRAWKPSVLFDWKHAEPVCPAATVSFDPLALVEVEVTLPAVDPVFTLNVTCVKPEGQAPFAAAGLDAVAPVGSAARNACMWPSGSTAAPTIVLPSAETPSASCRNHVPDAHGT